MQSLGSGKKPAFSHFTGPGIFSVKLHGILPGIGIDGSFSLDGIFVVGFRVVDELSIGFVCELVDEGIDGVEVVC